MKIRYLFLLVLLCGCSGLKQTEHRFIIKHYNVDFPTCLGDESDLIYLQREAYDSAYSKKNKIALWTEYIYKKSDIKEKRYTGSWKEDFDIPEEYRSKKEDYSNIYKRDLTGFDKGHQCPDAVAKAFGLDAQKETYFYSNATPQYSNINQKVWRLLENMVRDLSIKTPIVYAITGPVIDIDVKCRTIGPNKITVPDYYFLIISYGNINDLDNFYCKSYLVQNSPLLELYDFELQLIDFETSVNNIEELTSFDFLFNDSGTADDLIEKRK